jgi:uncharacterized OsmC-like protein
MEALRAAFERCAKALTRKPSLGLATGVSRTRIRHGLTCEIEEGPWTLTADMPAQAGGQGSAPTPGVFGRAAFGSCLAIGYMLHAAKLGVPITSIEVEVQADYDDGALFGVSRSKPGYLEVRYMVTVESDAPEPDITRVLDEGDAHSPYLDIFSREQSCRRSVRIVSASSTSASPREA